MNKLYLIVVLILIYTGALAVENRYAVFFTDKEGSEYSIDDPEAFLSERTVQKRNKYGIEIKNDDLPVSKAYTDELLEYDLELMFTSRWLNAAIIEAEESLISQIEAKSYVKGVVLIAPGPVTNGRMPATIEIENRGTKEIHPVETLQANAVSWQNRMLGVQEMHKQGYMGENMLVAVFDSGFESVNTSGFFSHLFDDESILATRDFIGKTGNVYQYDAHGTKVLSTMAAYKSGEFVGVSYNADYVLCVTEDVRSEHNIEEFNWLLAAEYADSLGVDVISSSVAYSYFDDPSESYTYSDMDGRTTVVSRAAKIAARKGMIVVASVGNEGNKGWKYLNAPSDADSVLGIGAIDNSIEKTTFSSFGPSSDGRIKPDLVALGSGVSVVSGENIGLSNGTSFSTPLVAGLVTGFWQAFSDLSPWEVTEYLRTTASNSESPDTLIGYGLPNFVSAADLVLSAEEDVLNEFTVYPNPATGRRICVFSAGMLDLGDVEINFFDLEGKHVKQVKDKVFSDKETLEIDITNLTPGYYFLFFNTESKTIKSKLIVR